MESYEYFSIVPGQAQPHFKIECFSLHSITVTLFYIRNSSFPTPAMLQ